MVPPFLFSLATRCLSWHCLTRLTMRYLLIDNSNTRTKFATGDDNSLDEWLLRVSTPELSPQILDEILNHLRIQTKLQIKKLSETIANFAKPVAKPPSDDSADNSF